jgi:hypothetical protein
MSPGRPDRALVRRHLAALDSRPTWRLRSRGLDQAPACRVIFTISGAAPIRIGGPTNPQPRLT